MVPLDYKALHNSISTPTNKWLNLIADPEKQGRVITDRPFTQLSGTQVTKAWLDSDPSASSSTAPGPPPTLFYGSSREPIVIPRHMGGFTSLGGRLPDLKLGFQDVANLVGRDKVVDVIDVASQSSERWSLGKWADYITEAQELTSQAESSDPQKVAALSRQKVYNIISLEISGTALGRKVRPPTFVPQVDWVDSFWPDLPGKRGSKGRHSKIDSHTNGANGVTADHTPELEEESGKEEDQCDPAQDQKQGHPTYPQVQLYCLMGMNGSWTDWHIDFAASSVYYTVHTGSKASPYRTFTRLIV